MLKLNAVILASALLCSACATSSVDDPNAVASQDEVTCRNEIATGTHMNLYECISQRERDRRSALAQQTLRTSVNRSYTSPAM
jgi:hypothetical protein